MNVDGRLRRDAIVAVVEPADVRRRDDPPSRRPHDLTRGRQIFAQRKMCSGAHVVRDVVREYQVEPSRAPDDDMIEALTPDRADDAFNVGVCLGCRLHRQRAVRHKPLGSRIPSIRSVAGRSS